MNRILFLFVIASVVAVSGCMDNGSTEDFSSLVEKAESTTYKINYSFDHNPGTELGLSSYDVKLLSHEGDRMVVSENSFLGMSTERRYYREPNNTVRCDSSGCKTQDRIIGTGFEGGEFIYPDRIKSLANISRTNSTVNDGRPCVLYEGNITDNERFDYDNSTIDICLDTEKGFVSYVEVIGTSYTGERERDFKYNMTGYSSEVDPSEVRLNR